MAKFVTPLGTKIYAPLWIVDCDWARLSTKVPRITRNGDFFILKIPVVATFFPKFQTNGASWPSCDAHQIAWTDSKFAQNISLQIVRSQYVYKTHVNVHRSALNTFFCLFEEIDYTVQLATACMLLHVHNCNAFTQIGNLEQICQLTSAQVFIYQLLLCLHVT